MPASCRSGDRVADTCIVDESCTVQHQGVGQCTLYHVFCRIAGVHRSWLWPAAAAAAATAAPISAPVTPAFPTAAKPAAPVSASATPSFPAAAKPATTTPALPPLLGYCAHMWPDAGKKMYDMLAASCDFVIVTIRRGFAKGPKGW